MSSVTADGRRTSTLDAEAVVAAASALTMNRAVRTHTVAVVAAHPVMEAGIRTVLEAHPQLTLVAPGEADVVVVDGLDEAPAGVPVVRLLGRDLPGPLPELSAPGGALLSRDASDDALVAAVLAAAAGLFVTDPDISLAEAAVEGGPGEDLTPREMEVLRLLAEGKPNKGIAFSLGVSEHTAKFHVGSILSKLDAGSRTEAVTVAIRRGLLPL